MVQVSPPVSRRLDQLGELGEPWRAGLDGLIADLESLWSCTVHNSLGGGSAAYVAAAIDRLGRPAVLKVAVPDGGEGYAEFERQALALFLGQPSTYVGVYEVNHGRRAMLLERLGPSLAEERLGVNDQIEIIA